MDDGISVSLHHCHNDLSSVTMIYHQFMLLEVGFGAPKDPKKSDTSFSSEWDGEKLGDSIAPLKPPTAGQHARLPALLCDPETIPATPAQVRTVGPL